MTMSDFDARAATWDDDPTKVERAQAVADAIVRSVPLASTMRAMEYGAGTGTGTSRCSSLATYSPLIPAVAITLPH